MVNTPKYLTFFYAICVWLWCTPAFSQISTVTTPDTNLCVQASVQLNTTPSGGSAYSYAWTPATGLSATNVANPTANPSSTTTYTVLVTETTSGDTVTDQVTISIQNIPPSIVLIPEADTICQGDTIQLDVVNSTNCAAISGTCVTSTSTATIAASTFNGFSAFDNPFFQTNNFFSTVSSNKRQIIYTKTELNNAGITGPTNISSLAFNVTFANTTFSYSNFIIKMGCTSNSSFGNYVSGLETVKNSSTVSISNTGWKEFTFDKPYAWDGNNNIVVEVCFSNSSAGTTTPGIQFSIMGSNQVRFDTADVNVCARVAGTAFNRKPNVQFKYCDYVSTTGVTYSWTPGTGLSSTSIRNPLANPGSSTNYILTATDAQNCEFIDTVDITVVPNFTVTVNSDTTLCNSDSLNIVGTDNGTNVKYKWSSGGTIVNDSIKSTKGYFTTSTSVDLLAVSAAGCEKTESFLVDFNPPVDAAVLTDDTIICSGDAIPIDITTNASTCQGYSWITCPSTTAETFSGTSTFPTGGITVSPFDANNASTPGIKKQYLILANEINNITSSDAIYSLGFNIQNITNSTGRTGFTIKMKCTSTSAFSAGTGNFETGATTVYTSKNITLTTGWNDFVFDNPYVWDGSSNLIIEICWQNASSIGFGQTTMDWTTTSFLSQTVNWNSSNYCTETSYGFATTIRPEFRMNYCNSPPNPAYKYAWTPSAGLNDDTIPNPLASPTANTSYKVRVTDPATGCFDEDSVLLTVAPNFNTTVTADSVLCFIDSVELSASHTSTGSVTYNWQPANLLTNNTIANPKLYVDKGKVIVSEIKSAAGCIKWDTVNLTITDQILSLIDTSGPVKCAGDSIQFSVIQTLGCGTSDNQLCTSLSTAQVGTSTTTTRNFNITPFVASTASGKKQFLIRKNELNNIGMNTSAQLTSLAFEITNVGLATYEGLSIRIGCTSSNSMSTNFKNDLEIVYDAKDVTLTTGTFWLDFDRRYNWDGLSNLIVEVCYLNSSTGVNTEVEYNAPGYNCLTYDRGGSVCNSGSGTAYNRRPNIFFRYCDFVPNNFNYSWSPANLFNDPGISNPKALIDDPGKYFLDVEYTPTGCLATDSIEFDFVDIEVNALSDTSLCTSEGFQLDVNTDAVNPLYFWSPATDVDDPAKKNPLITVPNGPVFIVEVTDSSGCKKQDTVDITILPRPSASVPPDVSLCRDEEHILFGGGGGSYLWSPSKGLSDPTAQTPAVITDETTTYVLTVTGSNGCTDEDSVTVTIYPSPILDLGPDTTYCIGGDLLLNAGGDFTSFVWQDGSKDSSFLVTSDGKYWVRVNDQFNCEFIDTVEVGLSPPPITGIDWNTDLCNGDSAVLDALNAGSSYQWSTGETSQRIVVKDSGFYWVLIDDGKCKVKDSTTVRVYEYPPWIIEDEIIYCEKENPFGIILEAGDDQYQYEWSNGKVTPSIFITEAGTYSVRVANGQKCAVERSFEVKQRCTEYYYVPNSFTPNNDLINDYFGISVGNVDAFEFEIYTRWGELILKTEDPDFKWDGTLNGKEMPSTVYIWRIYLEIKEPDGSIRKEDDTGTFNLLK